VADQRDAPTNWAQARAQIDRGETGDKIAAPDPATAPLGTDAEAGGFSTKAEDIARSARLQMQGARSRVAAQAPRTSTRRRLVPWLVVALALAAAILAALLVTG
jgi:hypothetical protein